MATDEICHKCDGCGRIANDEDGTPWVVWANLPPGSDFAVRTGMIRPMRCPDCGGTGKPLDAPTGMTEEEEIRQRKAQEAQDAAALEEQDWLPREPYALFPAGGYIGEDGHDCIIHKEISTEAQCFLLFESIVDADRVGHEYLTATGRTCEPRRVDVWGIEERFWVKYYPAGGAILQCPVEQYRKRASVGGRRDAG